MVGLGALQRYEFGRMQSLVWCLGINYFSFFRALSRVSVSDGETWVDSSASPRYRRSPSYGYGARRYVALLTELTDGAYLFLLDRCMSPRKPSVTFTNSFVFGWNGSVVQPASSGQEQIFSASEKYFASSTPRQKPQPITTTKTWPTWIASP